MTQAMPTSNLSNLQQCNATLLQQLITFLSNCPAEKYACPPSFTKASIGAHTRHIIDYYLAFNHGLADARINYCKRNRDIEVETNINKAVELGLYLIDQLANLDSQQAASRMRMIDGDFGGECDTTIERELSFLANHALHHIASIAFIAKDLDIETSENFGLAPSTIQHLEKKTRVHT